MSTYCVLGAVVGEEPSKQALPLGEQRIRKEANKKLLPDLIGVTGIDGKHSGSRLEGQTSGQL